MVGTVGCGAIDTSSGTPCPTGGACSAFDGGAGGAADGGTSMRTPEGGFGADGPAPPEPQSDELVPSADAVSGFSDAATACFDGVDPDLDGLVDCEEEVCQRSTSACCVGTVSADCCAAPSPTLTLDFSPCTPSTPAACTVGLRAFGTTEPHVELGTGGAPTTLVMGGDDTTDRGLLTVTPIDFTTRNVRLAADIELPSACSGDCSQTAAIAVTGREYALGTAQHVRPLIALIVSASLGQVLIVAGDTVVARTSVASAASTHYTLELGPDGTVRVTGGVADLTARWAPPTQGWAVLYGRNVNPPSTEAPARFGAFGIAAGLCDMPGAWGVRGQALPQLASGRPTWTDAPRVLRAPTTALDASGARIMLVETETDIVRAEEAMDGFSFNPAAPTLAEITVLAHGTLGDGTTAARVGDPSLLHAGGWDLWATAVDGTTGKRWVVHGSAPDGDLGQNAFRNARRITVDGYLPEALDLSAPDVVMRDGSASDLHMFARWEQGDGPRIAHLQSADGDTWRVVDDTPSVPPVRLVSADPSAFDASDVTGPSLVKRNGSWLLYFAGRNGARYGIGVLTSADLVLWREVSAAPALAASGTGFDALSVSDPAVFSEGDRVVVLYGGSDGADWRIGRVERDARSDRAF